MKKFLFVLMVLVLVGAFSTTAFAGKTLKKQRNQKDEAAEEESEDDPFTSVRSGGTAPNPLPYWGFGLGLGWRSDYQVLRSANGTVIAEPYRDFEVEYQTTEVFIGPSANLAVWDPYLSINLDVQMGILIGDMPSSFVLESFGFGAQYTFYNDKPLIFATGIGFRFISQSYKDVFSMDVFNMRPYITGGPVFEISESFSIGILPYFGIPLFFDTNSANDPIYYIGQESPTAPGTQGMPSSASFSDASGNVNQTSYTTYNETTQIYSLKDKNNPAIPPNRRQNYFFDESPGGVDYGLPIIFGLPYNLSLTAEVSGTAWLWPQFDSWNYVRPSIGYGMGPVGLTIGVAIPLDHRHLQEPFSLTAGAGVGF